MVMRCVCGLQYFLFRKVVASGIRMSKYGMSTEISKKVFVCTINDSI